MDFIKNNKTSVLGVAVILVLLFVYFTFFSAPGADPTLSAVDTNAAGSQELLATLQDLKSIKLDNSLFEDPTFISLTSFGVTIPPQNVGRRNPFIQLSGGTDAGTPITIPKSAQ